MTSGLRNASPDRSKNPGDQFALRAMLSLGFTLVQVWAMHTALTSAPPEGPARWGLALVLSAAFIAVLDSWAAVWRYLRNGNRRRVRNIG